MIRAIALMIAVVLGASAVAEERPTMAGVLEAAGPDDWRSPDPANTLYMQVQSGTVVIELAPQQVDETAL